MTLASGAEDLPKRLGELFDDPRLGLVSVRHGSGRDGVLPYKSVSQLPNEKPAIEIAHEDPYLTETTLTFDALLAEYGCTYTTVGENTYVYEVTSLGEDAMKDMDVVRGLADAGLSALAAGDIDGVEDVLREIEDIAVQWEDP